MAPRLVSSDPKVLEQRGNRMFNAKGRLKPGVSREAAQAELTAIGKNLEKAYPDSRPPTRRDTAHGIRRPRPTRSLGFQTGTDADGAGGVGIADRLR